MKKILATAALAVPTSALAHEAGGLAHSHVIPVLIALAVAGIGAYALSKRNAANEKTKKRK